MAVLKDNRKYQAMTVAEADDLFLRIARLKAAIDKETAAHKKKLADLELAHKEKIDPLNAEKDALEAHLEAYITFHSEDYVDPRKHPVGLIGSYGMKQIPAKVEITDKDAVLQYAAKNDLIDIIRVKTEPDNKEIFRRIQAGEVIPGAEYVPAKNQPVIEYRKGYAEALEA